MNYRINPPSSERVPTVVQHNLEHNHLVLEAEQAR